MSEKSLSIVIPVFNIADHIGHLEAELAKLAEIDPQVIVVDDGSLDTTLEALESLEGTVKDLTVIANPENRGAGVARNTGFPRATGTYTLFFDGDDYLHPDEILATIERLDQSGADVSINRYEFIRDGQDESTGMNVIDRDLWSSYLDTFHGRTFTLDEAPRFLEFTNYPWNKILRTAHYQALEIAPLFGETRVHNDVLGHWNILLNARQLALIDKTIVTHHVSGARDHLSSRFGTERLDLFVALRSIQALLHARSGPKRLYSTVYWPFVRRLVNWARGRLQANVLDEFDELTRALVTEITFEELLSLKKGGDEGTYRWLANKIG